MTQSAKLLSLEEEALESWYRFPGGNLTKIVDGIRYATNEAWEALEIDAILEASRRPGGAVGRERRLKEPAELQRRPGYKG